MNPRGAAVRRLALAAALVASASASADALPPAAAALWRARCETVGAADAVTREADPGTLRRSDPSAAAARACSRAGLEPDTGAAIELALADIAARRFEAAKALLAALPGASGDVEAAWAVLAAEQNDPAEAARRHPVSYTHLTLPTKRIV